MSPNIYDWAAALAGFVGLGAVMYAFYDPWNGFIIAAVCGFLANWLGRRGNLPDVP